MRLLYFSRDFTTHDHRFLSALAKTEHEVYYLRLERRSYQLEDRPLPSGIEFVHWSGGGAPVKFKDGRRLLRDLKRVIREIQPDLIQAGPLQRSALLVALAGFHPLMSMSWGYDLVYDAHRNPLWRWATRYTLQRSDMMLGDCDTIRDLAISFGMPAGRIVTFPWGIDLEHFSPPTSSRPQDGAFTLLSTRSWEPIYGVDVIARAFVQVARQRPEVRLVLLGNGSQAAMLRQTFARGDVADRVVTPGQVSHNSLPRYFRSADLYLSASHSDGTSISLLEAMACGCPVVVSDIPGNREWVTVGENGWQFPDGDANALAGTILTAIDRREDLNEMGRAARQVTELRADWKVNFQKLLDAYENILYSV